MASRNTTNNAKRAARRGKKTAERRGTRRAPSQPMPSQAPGFKCHACGVWSRPQDLGWEGFAIASMTREVRMLCPIHAPGARVEEVFADLLGETHEVACPSEQVARLIRLAQVLASEVFAECFSHLMHPSQPRNLWDVTRQDMADWAAEAVDRLDPPEPLRADFLVTFFEQFMVWLDEARDAGLKH